MALFLDQDKDSPRIDVESALDFIQNRNRSSFLSTLEYYYLPCPLTALDRLLRILARDARRKTRKIALPHRAGGPFQALRRRRKQQTRKLYGWPRTIPAVLDGVRGGWRSTCKVSRPAPNGGHWRDPAMDTAVFLLAAMWRRSGSRGPPEGSGSQLRRKTLRRIDADQRQPLQLAPLIILWQVSQLQAELAPDSFFSFASWSFDRVLRRAAGNQPVS